MNTKKCPLCGADMKRNGKTKAGTQRWRCAACGSSSSHRINADAKALHEFLDWLLSKDRQIDMPGEGRTFRRHASRFWSIWPMPPAVDEVHRVVYVDGIYLARDVVILIACSDQYVLSWYLARAETSASWCALLSQIAPPDMVIADGGPGFAKAVRQTWPQTKVQRCLFHVFSQVRRCTTSRPKLQAGRELYGLARELMRIDSLGQAQWWSDRFVQWCDFWSDFLSDHTVIGGRKEYTHERLRKARRGLVSLLNQGILFTYLDPELATEEALPSTNNRIEGGVNAQLRSLLREHRGMSTLRRIKAVYWWCYMHTECPQGAAEILRTMPTDDDIDALYDAYGVHPKTDNEPVEWGDGLVWSEFHTATRYPYKLD